MTRIAKIKISKTERKAMAANPLQADLVNPGQTRWERLVALTIARLQEFEPVEGYILCDSGGKDSEVLRALAIEAGVKYEAHHHLTTIDPPEVVRHVRHHHPETILDRPKESMVSLVRRKGLPSRWRRWCCQELKERTYPGRVVLIGIRWDESSRRSGRLMVEPKRGNGGGQTFLHPIVDWLDSDVWGYLRARGIETVSLYAEGRKRVGCVCCPLNPRAADADRWPAVAEALHRAWMEYWVNVRPAKEAEKCGPFTPETEFSRAEEAERTWLRWLATGRATQEPEVDDGCPLFADWRGPEEPGEAKDSEEVEGPEGE